VAVEAPFDGMAALFGVTLIAGWLLTFLLGILQRIVPFLASMHSSRGSARPPTPSSLTFAQALRVHFVAHLAALAALLVGVAFDSPWTVRIAAVAGTIGAVAFLVFFVAVVRRMLAARARAPVPVVAA
jgi:hypothetical protein